MVPTLLFDEQAWELLAELLQVQKDGQTWKQFVGQFVEKIDVQTASKLMRTVLHSLSKPSTPLISIAAEALDQLAWRCMAELHVD
mmetsp:Transcript_28371/g.67605  ORF Transcript_28371/g.67605 Transcript_28371/m.67605 type:complete len:85 (-) Transcript_28371:3438-3692(-)